MGDKLTKREAIRLDKKKYRAFLKQGGGGIYNLKDKELSNRLSQCLFYCPLCEYVMNKTGDTPNPYKSHLCDKCPLVEQFGKTCIKLQSYSNWRVFAKEIFKLKD